MATFNNGESLSSVRTKINDAIDKIDGNATISNNLDVSGTLTIDTINETTAAAGVTIDSVLLKDGGATFTSNVSFGDNDKAIFGAGSDLQIYHDGSNSYISDVGSGAIRFLHSQVAIKDEDGNENVAVFNPQGDCQLYYDNALKFATTSTGIDVTGTVNSDAFSLNAGSQVSSVGTFYLDIDSDNNSTGAALNITSDNKAKFLARFQEGGDISFYEDTGTTAKFFWDASAESLGIGTSSPSKKAHLYASNDSASLRLENTANSKVWDITPARPGVANTGLSIHNVTDGRTDLHIDNLGNVGIGTSSPSQQLTLANSSSSKIQIKGHSASNGLFFGMDSATAAQIWNAENGFMRFATNDTERMRIDSSGNVLVGLTSGSSKLHVNSEISVGADGDNRSMFGYSSGRFYLGTRQSGTNYFNTLSVTSGQVGIGTTSPQQQSGIGLHINNSSGQSRIKLTSGTTGATSNDGFDIIQESDTGSPVHLLQHEAGPLKFGTNNTERMRIDSSGNLLVGTTDTNLSNNTGTNTGFGVISGELQVARDGGVAMFNRTSTDGSIVNFRKDGTTVGSIGTKNGALHIGSTTGSDSYFGFYSNQIIPTTSDGSDKDAVTDLGYSGSRFKDLYLSGGVYLGGTGSANKLDDYEEGTFTPSLRDSSGSSVEISITAHPNLYGRYIKIGNIVHVTYSVDVRNGFNMNSATGSNDLFFHGLPFSFGTGDILVSGFSWKSRNIAGIPSGYNLPSAVFAGENDTYLRLALVSTNGTAWTAANVSNIISASTSSCQFEFTLSYQTA